MARSRPTKIDDSPEPTKRKALDGIRGGLENRLALRKHEAAFALGLGERKFREVQRKLPMVDLDGLEVFPVEALREWLRAQAEVREGRVDRLVEEMLSADGRKANRR